MTSGNLDEARKKALGAVHEARGRNVIAYYSGFWQRESNKNFVGIDDNDRLAFYDVVSDLDPGRGLDLILHTPGGELAATESIGNYLREVFGTNIEVFVPFMAMSGGTMLACAAKTIHMGKQSRIGPIDPQVGGLGAGYILDAFKKACDGIKQDSSKVLLYRPFLEKFHLPLIRQCEQLIALSKEIVEKWLETGMLAKATGVLRTPKAGDDPKPVEALHTPKTGDEPQSVAAGLADYTEMRSHSRPIGIAKAQEIGLNITAMEKAMNKDGNEDKDIEPLVMAVHKNFMYTFWTTAHLKMVENHSGKSLVLAAQSAPKG